MRTSFELKLVASNLEEAKAAAAKQISEFLGIKESELEDRVSVELKISYPKAETVSEIEDAVASKVFQVTAFGSVKQGTAKPFGF
jgi:hypothetical protein